MDKENNNSLMEINTKEHISTESHVVLGNITGLMEAIT
jgi:hypothetical protein